MSRELSQIEVEVLEELLQGPRGIRELSITLHQGYPADFDYPQEHEEGEDYETDWDMSGPNPKETKEAVRDLLKSGYILRRKDRKYDITRRGGGALLRRHLE